VEEVVHDALDFPALQPKPDTSISIPAPINDKDVRCQLQKININSEDS